ncbi:hypothetical protein ScPMuIL_015240 [Solemya velum]
MDDEKLETEKLSEIWVPDSQYKDTATAELLSDNVFELCLGSKENGKVVSNDFHSVTLSWQHLNVSLPAEKNFCRCLRRRKQQPSEPRMLLNDVTGIVKPGTLLAVMGSSGAGKTTLLNALAYRTSHNLLLEGDIRVNGINLGSKIRDISGYMQNDDTFIGVLTVKEHLIFRALLRMDKSISKRARLQRVDDVIRELSLTKCENSIIGASLREQGISSGEKRRLAFASEALTNPPLIFCDEPTSGLDSYMSRSIIKSLKSSANKDQTIICSIHQPSSEIFELFDNILFVAEGRVAYMGLAKEALGFFSRQSFKCPQNYNPADFYINTLGQEPGDEAKGREKIKKICDAYIDSELFNGMNEEIYKTNASRIQYNFTLLSFVSFYSICRFCAPVFRQLWIMFMRCIKCTFREPLIFRGRVLQVLVTAIVFGLFFYKQDYNQEGVININGAIFLIIINMSIQHMMSAIRVFPHEMPIFLKEYGIGMYRVDVYFFCRTMAELPLFMLYPFLFGTITYWMIGLQESIPVYLIFSGILVLEANTANAYGYFMSTLFGDPELAFMAGSGLMTLFVLLGGFLLNLDTIPDYLSWMQYLSWIKYAMTLLFINQWEEITFIECNKAPVVLEMTNGTVMAPSQCFRNGAEVLQAMHFEKEDFFLNSLLLLVLCVGMRLLAFILLFIRAKRSTS